MAIRMMSVAVLGVACVAVSACGASTELERTQWEAPEEPGPETPHPDYPDPANNTSTPTTPVGEPVVGPVETFEGIVEITFGASHDQMAHASACDAHFGRACQQARFYTLDQIAQGARSLDCTRPQARASVAAGVEITSEVDLVALRLMSPEHEIDEEGSETRSDGRAIAYATVRAREITRGEGLRQLQIVEWLETDVCRTAQLSGGCIVPEGGDLCVHDERGGLVVSGADAPESASHLQFHQVPGGGSFKSEGRYTLSITAGQGSTQAIEVEGYFKQDMARDLDEGDAFITRVNYPHARMYMHTVRLGGQDGELTEIAIDQERSGWFDIATPDDALRSLFSFYTKPTADRGAMHLWGNVALTQDATE